jgi:hypothetical protein
MFFRDVVILINVTYSQNAIGDIVETYINLQNE